jgi:predicted DNA-binding transcriptional regulator AlpA
MADPEALLWSIAETAAKLGLSKQTTWRRAIDGDFTVVRLGGRTMILASSVYEFIAKQVSAPSPVRQGRGRRKRQVESA